MRRIHTRFNFAIIQRIIINCAIDTPPSDAYVLTSLPCHGNLRLRSIKVRTIWLPRMLDLLRVDWGLRVWLREAYRFFSNRSIQDGLLFLYLRDLSNWLCQGLTDPTYFLNGSILNIRWILICVSWHLLLLSCAIEYVDRIQLLLFFWPILTTLFHRVYRTYLSFRILYLILVNRRFFSVFQGIHEDVRGVRRENLPQKVYQHVRN